MEKEKSYFIRPSTQLLSCYTASLLLHLGSFTLQVLSPALASKWMQNLKSAAQLIWMEHSSHRLSVGMCLCPCRSLLPCYMAQLLALGVSPYAATATCLTGAAMHNCSSHAPDCVPATSFLACFNPDPQVALTAPNCNVCVEPLPSSRLQSSGRRGP